MELTQSEINLVLKHRQQSEMKKQEDVLTAHCLKTAANFETWRQTGGFGTSYSTFLNDFEYKEFEGLNHKTVYNRVLALLNVARHGDSA